MEFNLVEITGYLASLMLVISFLMKNIISLRVLNSIGCGLFVLYGIQTGAYPVAFTNAFIVCINMYHLIKMMRSGGELAAS